MAKNPMYKKSCVVCGKEFLTSSNKKVTCCDKCSMKHSNDVHRAKEKEKRKAALNAVCNREDCINYLPRLKNNCDALSEVIIDRECPFFKEKVKK